MAGNKSRIKPGLGQFRGKWHQLMITQGEHEAKAVEQLSRHIRKPIHSIHRLRPFIIAATLNGVIGEDAGKITLPFSVKNLAPEDVTIKGKNNCIIFCKKIPIKSKKGSTGAF